MPELDVGEHLYRFPGGLRLRHHKQVACRQPLARPDLPDTLYLPLLQHQGTTGELLVEPGDRVVKGQALTTAEHDREVPIHAPTSGTVRAIRRWPVSWPPDSESDCLVLEPDGEETWIEREPVGDWPDADPDLLTDRLRAAGLSGLGGAMFPTAAKLRGDWGGVHTVILNGSECEPYIACDEMLMRERPEAIVEGGLILGNPDCNRRQFTRSLQQLGERMFPEYRFRPLAASSPIFTFQQFGRAAVIVVALIIATIPVMIWNIRRFREQEATR